MNGIGPSSGFSGGTVVGAYIGGLMFMMLGLTISGAIIIAAAIVAHAIRDLS